jgi:branched-chain amino acid transport system ATP-binding protein
MTAILIVEDVCAGYGDTQVLANVSFAVGRGEAVALLGRNGMGKTTCLLAIMGLNPPRSGSIRFKDTELVGRAPYEIARLGIGYSPEGRRLFAPLTVVQNLRIPFVNKHPDRSQWRAQLERVFDIFPRLRERSEQRAGSLSGGEQQMLAIARTLIGADQLLVLDEPTEGLAPAIVDTIIEAIQTLKREGLTVLLVEQNARRAFEVADRAYVLEKGRVTLSGTTAELIADMPRLRHHVGMAAEAAP